jgi:hypothetical protein
LWPLLSYPKSGIVTCRRFNRNGFDNFINRYNLDIEVDKHCKAFFVRIGSYTSPKGKVSVKCQKKEDVPKPRLSSKLRELIVEARGHMLSTFSDNQPASVDNSTTQDTTSDPHLTTHDTTSDPYLSPVEHPELESFKLLVKSRLIVKLLVNDDDNQPILWQTELTVESIIQSIECIHQELQARNAIKVAETLKSKPVPVDK